MVLRDQMTLTIVLILLYKENLKIKNMSLCLTIATQIVVQQFYPNKIGQKSQTLNINLIFLKEVKMKKICKNNFYRWQLVYDFG